LTCQALSFGTAATQEPKTGLDKSSPYMAP
jgi:hypothetical protein